jgi:hypothetical protein
MVQSSATRGKEIPHPCISSDEVARRGEDLYDREIRARVETDDNVGRIISIDVETGDYEVGDDPLETGQRIQSRHPGAPIWTKRIGYNAVYAVGGTLIRMTP